MAQSKIASALRKYLKGSELRILPGGNPSRPAPAHIMNKFSKSLIGNSGKSSSAIHSLMYADLSNSNLPKVIDGAINADVVQDFSNTLHSIFNADRRSFPSMYSYLLLSKDLISSDPSDDNYGQALVELFTKEQIDSIQVSLIEILDESKSPDVISKFTSSLLKLTTISKDDTSVGDFVNDPINDSVEIANASAFGDVAYEIISHGLERMKVNRDDSTRVKNVQRLSTMLSGLVSLGLIYDAARIHESIKNAPRGEMEILPHEILGIVCFTGVPPGAPRDVRIKLATASFSNAIERAHKGISHVFVSYSDPTSDVSELVTKRVGGEDARNLIQAFNDFDVLSNPEINFKKLFSESDLKRAVKALAGKVGFAGPIKGKSATRMFMETSFLETLVYFLGENNKPYSVFVDNCYTKLGLILGSTQFIDDAQVARLKSLVGRNNDVKKTIAYLDELLRKRLVETGLAQEFSDGHTVIRIV